MEDNKKLTSDLVLAKDKIDYKQLDLNNLHTSYDCSKESHQQLDKLVVNCRSENNKLADMLEEK